MADLFGTHGFRKEITIQDTNVDSDLTDFPCYIDVTADADFHEARADGYDIRFTESDGSTLLKYEREYWTGGNGSAATAHFWVKVPSILATGGATIYCYYGDADASDGEDAANVWDANFVGVWHGADATATTIADSTSSGITGTKKGSGEPPEGTGVIHKAQDFDGADDYINLTNNAALNPSDQISIEAWVYMDSTGDSDYPRIIRRDACYVLYINTSGADNGRVVFNVNDSDLITTAINTSVPGQWYHIAAVYNKDEGGATEAIVYIDGASAGTDDYSTAITQNSNIAYLGNRPDGSRSFDGEVCEIRISDIKRVAAWVKFEHANMNESDNELTWGSEESSGYVLACDAGSYAITGTALDTLHGKQVTAAAGSYAMTGTALDALHTKLLDADAGSYALTGTAVSLLHDKKITCAAGSYAITGTALTPLHAKLIAAGPGSYVITGTNVGLLYSGGVSVKGSELHMFMDLSLN